jgi:tRNA-dihydrouridine synthase
MAFTLYPAIDLKAGQVVRLKRGEMDQATVYSSDPAAQAAGFKAAGFGWVHVVDLDGAFAGRPANADAVRGILAAVPGLPVQLGGGIRDMATAEAWLEAGVARIILGSAAVKDPAFARAEYRSRSCRREASSMMGKQPNRRFNCASRIRSDTGIASKAGEPYPPSIAAIEQTETKTSASDMPVIRIRTAIRISTGTTRNSAGTGRWK